MLASPISPIQRRLLCEIITQEWMQRGGQRDHKEGGGGLSQGRGQVTDSKHARSNSDQRTGGAWPLCPPLRPRFDCALHHWVCFSFPSECIHKRLCIPTNGPPPPFASTPESSYQGGLPGWSLIKVPLYPSSLDRVHHRKGAATGYI